MNYETGRTCPDFYCKGIIRPQGYIARKKQVFWICDECGKKFIEREIDKEMVFEEMKKPPE